MPPPPPMEKALAPSACCPHAWYVGVNILEWESHTHSRVPMSSQDHGYYLPNLNPNPPNLRQTLTPT